MKIKLEKYIIFLSVLSLLNIFILNKATAQHFYFGDLHLHSNYSDGKGHPKKVYDYAINVSKLDFMCLSDHDIYPQDNSSKWDSLIYFANHYNMPGKFASFIGYEYTSFTNGVGHRVVIYPENTGKLFKASSTKISELINLVKDYGGIVNIAHPNSIPFAANITSTMGLQESNIEVLTQYSNYEFHNNPKSPNNQLIGSAVQDWFASGKVLGVLGNTDSHNGEPGKLALTGVYSDSLSRNSIFSAIKNRHTFATTGKKISLILRSGNYIMGDTIHHPLGTQKKFNFECRGTADIEKIEVIKNGNILYAFSPNNPNYSSQFTDSDSLYYSYYYLRVTQKDGNMAWSSPIFFIHNYLFERIGDSINLTLNGLKEGKIQWQFSTDKIIWNNIEGENKLDLIHKVTEYGHYRAKVQQCDGTIYYSETFGH